MLSSLFAGAVVFAAGLVRGATGFGFALLAAIGLSLVMPVAQVTPVVLLIEIVLSALILREGGFGALDRRRAVPLMAGGVLGVLGGYALVSGLPGDAVAVGLNLAVLASAAVTLLRVETAGLDTRGWAVAIGALVGALIAAFAVGGPLAVVWLLASGAAPAAIRATVSVFFGMTDSMSIGVRLLDGSFPAEALVSALWLLPLAGLGTLAGGALFARIDPAHWRRAVAAFLVAAAVLNLLRTLSTS
ncbi:sulfite exporter TauE/SafE family protein [Arenibaculum pallidiluteum]|uniref:sulfite exporter TauE/SafE family protein n=1 Tax=Arenibaculum pallidiluteum TaxID=2812559 RepID=UPI001A95B21C|nr:sulfite exporter TauE/SafE family protein [Arenibaculum pallidiluteum]